MEFESFLVKVTQSVSIASPKKEINYYFIPFFSKNHGLHLILNDVIENGPAWESGVRAGDVIVTINDWLIVLMDRPQVGFTNNSIVTLNTWPVICIKSSVYSH
jgi:hypothetical protein